jgi:hypothetical protein
LNDMLWRFYIAANAPSTRGIAQAIASQDDDSRAGTANHETVRRTLRASNLPAWQTVEVIFLALCQIANIDPDDEDDTDDYDRQDPAYTHRDELHRRYRLARFGTGQGPPRTRDEKMRQEAEQKRAGRRVALDDPWGSAPASSGFSDEPPF